MKSWWFVAGAAAGVYATTKVRRAAEALTVDGVHDRLTGWFAGARVLADEVRTGAAVKETELRERLSLVPDEGPARLEGRRHLQLAPRADQADQADHADQADQHDETHSTGRDDN
ncbi:DUF6167 family protein [Nocardioides caldifontis]|uniref:DUF6167 family protein n=1 Tax=Nocardioides caldifontis TaxID=2588938 RepID=UPI0013969FEC|nr:DUF6167 family protein [Nocardioides caldifontis]